MKLVYDEELIPRYDVMVDGYRFKRGCVYNVHRRDESGGRVLNYIGMERPVVIHDLTPFRLIRKPRWELGRFGRTVAALCVGVIWAVRGTGHGK